MPVSFLNYKLRGLTSLVGSQASECVGAFDIGEIVESSPAYIGNIDTEVNQVLVMLIAHRIRAVEVIFGFAKVGLGTTCNERALHHNTWLLILARKPIVIVAN